MLTFTQVALEKLEAYRVGAEERDGVPRAVRIALTGAEREAPHELSLVAAGRPASGDVLLDVGEEAPFSVHVPARCRKRLRGARVDFVARDGTRGFDVVLRDESEGPEDAAPTDGSSVEDRVREVIREEVNPTVASHGGALELVEVEDGVAKVEMSGGCQGCAASALTLQAMVRRMIASRVPEIIEIEDVTDHSEGDEPYYPTADELRSAAAGG